MGCTEESLRNSMDPKIPYVYNALRDGRDIRLMRFSYSEIDKIIVCSLFPKPLDTIVTSPAKYYALSYVWGDPNETITVLCDGKSLDITKNLHALLLELCDNWEVEPDISKYFWADAICINQADDAEKTQQVRLMQDIYHHADGVIAWLGEATEIDKRGFAFIDRLLEIFAKNSSIDAETQESGFDYQNLSKADLEGLGIPGIEDAAWDDLRSVMEKAWFSRVWVVGELLLAKESRFQCGSVVLHIDTLLQFASSFMETPLYRDIMISRPQAMSHSNACRLSALKSRLDRGETLTIFDLLWHTTHFEASDPRDKVFSMVGLASDLDSTFIDYSDAIPHQMLLRLAKHLLNISDNETPLAPNLSMLSYSQAISQTLEVPSWVPNWTVQDYSMTPLALYFHNSPSKSEQRLSSQNVTRSDDDGLLLPGRLIDRIEAIIEDDSGESTLTNNQGLYKALSLGMENIEDWYELMTKIAPGCEHMSSMVSKWRKLVDDLGSYPTNEELSDVCWRSLMLDDERLQDSKYRENLTHLSLVGTYSAEIVQSIRRLKTSTSLTDIESVTNFLFSLSSCFSAVFLAFLTLRWIKGGFYYPDPLWTIGGLLFWLFVVYILGVLARFLSIPSEASAIESMKQELEELGQRCVEFLKVDKEIQHFVSVLWTTSYGRFYSSTERGYVGWMPSKARKGDEIWVFQGCRLPFVLRWDEARQGDERAYRLMGDCYIHGLMSIEASARIDAETERIKLI